jgi:hypothetical protein
LTHSPRQKNIIFSHQKFEFRNTQCFSNNSGNNVVSEM